MEPKCRFGCTGEPMEINNAPSLTPTGKQIYYCEHGTFSADTPVEKREPEIKKSKKKKQNDTNLF